MSRRRSQSEMAVSLFPFLAVLVCAMGSLILLLLIITRNVHPSYQTRQEDPVELDEGPQLIVGESVSAQQMTLPETGFAPAEIGSARWKTWQPAATIGQTDAPGYDIDLHADAATRMRRQTQFQQQTQRDEKLAMLKNQLLQAQQRREELQQQRQQLQTSMNSSQMSLQQTRQQQMKLAQQLQELQQTAPQLNQEIKRLTDLLEQKKNQQKPVSNEYEIVALDRKSGQVHTPIFVECRKQKIKVQPELLEADSEQLTDYSPKKNPLAIAILEHWKRGPHAAEQPYVLLIVSPDGIEEFYTMSQLLIANDIHYGYELIDPDQTFFYGTPNQILSQQMQHDFTLALETQPRHQRELAVVEVPTRAGQQSNNYESIMDSITAGLAARDAQRNPAKSQGTPPQLQKSPNSQGFPQQALPQQSQPEMSQPGLTSPQPAPAFPEQENLANQSSRIPSTQNQSSSSFKRPRSPFDPPPGASGQGNASPIMPTIGIERRLEVIVGEHSIRIGKQPELTLPPGLTREQVAGRFQGMIQQEMNRWDAAPEGMHWNPVLRFRVEPGGNFNAVRLEQIAESSQLEYSSSYLFEERTTDLFEQVPSSITR